MKVQLNTQASFLAVDTPSLAFTYSDTHIYLELFWFSCLLYLLELCVYVACIQEIAGQLVSGQISISLYQLTETNLPPSKHPGFGICDSA